ncbi:MAG: VWA domain-containing protein [Terriglobales bacterium]
MSRCDGLIALLALCLSGTLGLAAQSTQTPPAGTPASADAGGPQGGAGPIIIPRKSTTAPTPPPPPPPKPVKPEYSFSVTVPEVQLPVIVETKNGDFIGHLGKDNFRVVEDGVPQTIDKVAVTADAPMTAIMLVEFRNTFYPLLYDILQASYYFTDQLQPQDWVALITYDMKTQIVVDFTHDKRAILGGLRTLQFPGFSEANLFDALADTVDRIQDIPGRKAIILISTGVDTFSKLTFDKIRKKLEATDNVSIFAVSIGWAVREYMETHGVNDPIYRLDNLQADNQMQYFAKVTGGRFYQPRFEGAFPEVFQDIASAIRNQYVLSYKPTNKALDGSFRKVKIEVTQPNGEPLHVVNQKGKPVKYEIVAKNGYYSKHVVE